MPDRPVRCLIYDLDGLLLDTESINDQVTQTIAQRYGKAFQASTKAQVVGRDALTSARLWVEALALPLTAQEFLAERRALIRSLRPTAQPMPGALDLTQRLHQAGVPQAIATSSSRDPFAWKAEPHQAWLACFQAIVLSDDPAVGGRSKPAPDLFLVAADRLGYDPADCLVLEDSPAGIAAAEAAGMRSIAIPDPLVDRSLYQAAAAILPDLTAFDPVAWGLLPATSEPVDPRASTPRASTTE